MKGQNLKYVCGADILFDRAGMKWAYGVMATEDTLAGAVAARETLHPSFTPFVYLVDLNQSKCLVEEYGHCPGRKDCVRVVESLGSYVYLRPDLSSLGEVTPELLKQPEERP